MSLVFAAVTPHPPLLIPSIGKDEIERIAKTKAAFERLEEDMYLAKPQAVLVISPHMSLFADAFSINAHTPLVSQFEHFGDLTTKRTWHGSPEIAARISAAAKRKHLPVQLVSQESIDHGASVPLFFLTRHLPDVKILPLGFSSLPTEKHLEYGELLKEIILQDNRRIAVIASGDLSHALTVEAPNDYHEDGQKFDDSLRSLLEVRNTAGIAALDATLVANAHECGYRSILILLGLLKNIHYNFKTYSYEAPFGVGYLAGNFVL